MTTNVWQFNIFLTLKLSHSIIYMQSININGPVNVVRLEGNINDISKVIYFMFDFHNNVNNQTKCNDIRSYYV